MQRIFLSIILFCIGLLIPAGAQDFLVTHTTSTSILPIGVGGYFTKFAQSTDGTTSVTSNDTAAFPSAFVSHNAVFNGSISGTTLSVNSVSAGIIAVGQTLSFSSVVPATLGTAITSTTTGCGAPACYTVNISQTVTSQAMISSGIWLPVNTASSMGTSYANSVLASPSLQNGVYDITVAPSDPNRIYFIQSGILWKSTNSGVSFSQTACTSFSIPAMSANIGGQRLNGPRIVVDPHNPDIVLIGDPVLGLYMMIDGNSCTSVTAVPPAIPTSSTVSGTATGTTGGNQITFASAPGAVAGEFAYDTTNPTALPSGTTVSGTSGSNVTLSNSTASVAASDIIFFNLDNNSTAGAKFQGYVEQFDDSGWTSGNTQTMYSSAWGSPVYVSTNGGSTWAPTNAGGTGGAGPTTASSAAVAYPSASPSLGTGILWLVSQVSDFTGGNSNVWTYTASAGWVQLSSAIVTSSAHAVAVDKHTNGSTTSIYLIYFATSNTAASCNNGASFSQFNNIPTVAQLWAADVGWLNSTSGGSNGTIVFDPSITNKLWYTTGVGVFWSFPPCLRTTQQYVFSQNFGMEDLTSNVVSASPGSTLPLEAVWDRGIFQSPLTSAPSSQISPAAGIIAAWDIDWAKSSPSTFCALIDWNGPLNDQSGCFTGGVFTQFAYSPWLNQTVVSASASAQNTINFPSNLADIIVTGLSFTYVGTIVTATQSSATGATVLHFGSLPAQLANGMKIATFDRASTPHTGQSSLNGGPSITINTPNPGDLTISAATLGPVNIGDQFAITQVINPFSGTTKITSINSPTQVTVSANLVGSGLLSGETVWMTSKIGGGMAVRTRLNIIWHTSDDWTYPFYTTDGGNTWHNVIICTSCTGFDANGAAIPSSSPPITGWCHADFAQCHQATTDGVCFWLYNTRSTVTGGGVYKSCDGGVTWTNTSGQLAGGNGLSNTSIKANPYTTNDLFFISGAIGQTPQRSTNGGVTWGALDSRLTAISALGFGLPQPGRSDPTVFIVGNVSGTFGFYMSPNINDATPTWNSLGQFPVGYIGAGNNWACIEGDKIVLNKFYACAGSGGGFIQGRYNYLLERDLDPAANDNIPVGLGMVG